MGSSGDNDVMEFQNAEEDILNCPSSGMNINPFFASAWDPNVSLSQHESFDGSSIVSQSGFTNSPYPVMLGNQGGISSTSHPAHFPSDSSFVEMVQKFPCFGSGGYSEIAGSLGLSQCGQIVNTGCPSSYTTNIEGNDERNMANGAQSLTHQQFSEEAAIKALPNGKQRKRGAESTTPLNADMKTEGEQKKDSPGEISDVPNEQDDKRPKTEQNSGVDLKGKQASKQSKENSHSGGDGDGPKENYIHMRARRGQATNSHSLAERVRREKISERMRLLQELVPGCNKITGKAVMLDEIINYVQSLQQQVEFLSMKLATVNPELNIDIERILSKEIIQSRCGNPSSVFGFSPGINSLPYSHGTFQAGMPIIPNTNPQFSPTSQAILDSELQNLFRMGFDSNSAMDSLGPTAGRLKPEL